MGRCRSDGGVENVNRGKIKGQSSEYAIPPALLDFFPFILLVQLLTHSNSTQFPRSGLDRSKIERIKRDIVGRVEEMEGLFELTHLDS